MLRRLMILASIAALALSLLPLPAVAQTDAPETDAPDARADVYAGDRIPEANFPLAVDSATGIVPEVVEIVTDDPTGTETYEAQSVEVTDLQSAVSGLGAGEAEEFTLPQDPNRNDPFDGSEGTEFFTWEVPASGATRIVADVRDTSAPDIDLFVGQGDTADPGTLVCVSAAAGSDEYCDVRASDFDIDVLPPGDYWAVVQNWQASDTSEDTVEFTYGFATPEDEGNLTVDAPSSSPGGEPFTVELDYDVDPAEDVFYGTVTLGTDPANPDNIGETGIDLHLDEDPAEPDARTQASARIGQAGELEFAPRTDTPASDTYLVRLAAPAVPSYTGGIDGLEPTAVPTGQRLDTSAGPVAAYRDFLRGEQDGVLAAAGDAFGRELRPTFRYDLAMNGFAVALSDAEAAQLAAVDGVVEVIPQQFRELTTDAGPEFISADAVWEGAQLPGVGQADGTQGEGIVAGIIDSGISPSNPSFAETGDDDYTHEWDDDYLGVCDPNADPGDELNPPDPTFGCNDKLVGAWNFVPGDDDFPVDARDDNGHGSHTASTVAGNVVDGVTVDGIDPEFDISGVAPHANVISYRVCGEFFGGSCGLDAIVGAINQSIDDEVDTVNYSIGSTAASDLYNDPDTTAFLEARRAGVTVVTSAGNSGPGPDTVGSPADAPWMVSVGAGEHNRTLANSVTDLTSADGAELDDLSGKGATDGLPAGTPIVYAGDYVDELGEGIELCNPASPPDNNPDLPTFPEGFFDGEIVVCDRGAIGRVAKSRAVADAGAGGFVHLNDEPSQASLNGDAFVIPGVHLSFADGELLKGWLDADVEQTAGIAGLSIDTDGTYADMQASFSSRGANRATDVVSPNVTAPGVDILAALGVATADDPEPVIWGFLSGTSMSSPHTAGAASLVTAVHPEWTPAEIHSALMTSSVRDDTVKEDNETPGDAFSRGAGRIDVERATQAGLLLDVTGDDYDAANPDEGGNPRDLNIPSLANSQCLGSCEWTRTVTGTVGATWTAEVDVPDGVSVTVEPAEFALAEGESIEVTFTAELDDPLADNQFLGDVTLVPEADRAELIRVDGTGRIETAIAVSQEAYPDGDAATVVLARADIAPDALAGVPVAANADGPLLLTNSNELVGIVADEIQRVLPSGGTVHVLGGEEAIEPQTAEAIEALGYDLVRISGQTRFETALAIAEFLGSPDNVLITTGLDFPDALAAGAAAGQVDGTVLLSAGDQTHPTVDGYLDAADDAETWAIGGDATRAYPDATPVFGATRDETAVEVAREFFGDNPTLIGFARRDDFADALSGGAHIARLGGPLLLTYTDSVPPEVDTYLCDATEGFNGGFVYGGVSSINEAVFDQLEARLNNEGCAEDG